MISNINNIQLKMDNLSNQVDRLAECITKLNDKGHNTTRLKVRLNDLYSAGAKMRSLIDERKELSQIN